MIIVIMVITTDNKQPEIDTKKVLLFTFNSIKPRRHIVTQRE